MDSLGTDQPQCLQVLPQTTYISKAETASREFAKAEHNELALPNCLLKND